LHTKTSVENGLPVLFVEGRLGHAATAELEAVATRHASSAAEKLVVDLSGVDYLSGAALKVFDGLAKRQSQRGGRLSLRAPSVAARLALELAGLLALVDS
jgi:stage II sporulation protein AA (anti-sigma F factor antagonist)